MILFDTFKTVLFPLYTVKHKGRHNKANIFQRSMKTEFPKHLEYNREGNQSKKSLTSYLENQKKTEKRTDFFK